MEQEAPRKKASSNINKWYAQVCVCENILLADRPFQCSCLIVARHNFILLLFECFSCIQLSERARERKVPVTRIGRLVNFGGKFVYWPFFVVKKKKLVKKRKIESDLIDIKVLRINYCEC